jgi:glutathione peroxidase
MTQSIYDYTARTIEGRPRKLDEYRGKALLIVNVASQCGLTPQYKGLEELHEAYAEKGLAILAFPANEFGSQEPGSNAEIQKFCETSYGVKFDLFEKVKVKGPGIDPIFAYLTSPDTNPHSSGEIRWNFNKFLLGRNGAILARFEPKVEPTGEDVRRSIEAALAT